MKHTGDSYFDSQSFRRLLKDYEDEMAQNRPIFMDVDELADIADYYNLIGEYGKAVQATELSIQLHPGAVYPLVFKAHEALDRNDFTQARRLASAIIDKEDIEYKYLVAEIMMAEGDVLKADTYLTDCLRSVSAEDTDSVCVDCGNLFLDYNHDRLATKWMQLCQDKSSVSYQELRGKIFYIQKKYKECIQVFQELIDVNPYDARYWKTLAEAHFYISEMDDAIQCIDYAIAINPDDKDCYGLKGDCYIYLEEYAEAAKYYGRYYQEDQSNMELNYSYGVSLIHTKRVEEALDIFQKIAQAIQTESKDQTRQLYTDLALAYAELRDEEKALQCIGHIKDEDNTPQEMVAMAHIMLCFNHIEEAKELYIKAIHHEEANGKPLLSMQIAASLFDNGYVEQCYRLLKRSISVFEEPIIDTWPYLALCCKETHRDEEFLYFLKEAVERAPKRTKQLLKDLFPLGMEVEQYYDYMYNQINNKL